MRPFRVFKKVSTGTWVLEMRTPGRTQHRFMYGFATAGDAIDHAYRNWPWWL